MGKVYILMAVGFLIYQKEGEEGGGEVLIYARDSSHRHQPDHKPLVNWSRRIHCFLAWPPDHCKVA